MPPARSENLRVLMVTTGYPGAENVATGVFVERRVEALKRLGVDVDVLAFRSRANPLNHWRAWRELRRMLSAKRYDLIHAQFGQSGLVARMQLHLPVIITYRGSDLLGTVNEDGAYTLKGRINVLLSQALALVAREVIVVSSAMARRLPRRDYHVIPSGLDLERFIPIPMSEARSALGWPQDRRIVLFAVENVEQPRKRFGLAREAVERVSARMPVELRVVSGVPPDEMPLHINAGDALLLTSMHEGSPNVVKEALACNLPVVSVDVGDVRDRLQGVTPGGVYRADPDSLAAGLEAVLRRGGRSNGREKVAGLTESELAARVLGVYRSAIR